MDKRSQSLRQLTFEANQDCGEEIKEIVDEIGLVRVMQYLNRIATIRGYDLVTQILKCNLRDVGFSYVCGHLTIDQLVKYVTGMIKLPQILVYFDRFRIHLSVPAIIAHIRNQDRLQEIHENLCPAIIRNPVNRVRMTFALSVVQFGNVVIKRIHTTESGDLNFFDRILRTYPLVNNTQSSIEESKPPKIVCQEYHDLHKFMEQIVTGRFPEDRVNEIRRAIAKRRLQNKKNN